MLPTAFSWPLTILGRSRSAPLPGKSCRANWLMLGACLLGVLMPSMSAAQTVLTTATNNLILVVGRPFSATYTATPGTSALSLVGTTPPGLTFSASVGLATLAGTPTAAGNYTFTVRVYPPTFAAAATALPYSSPFSVVVAGAPTVSDLILAVPYATPGAIDLTGAASGALLTGLTFSVTSGPSHGTATLAGSRLTYTPTPGYTGSDGLAFTATAIGGTSSPAHLAITVGLPPDPSTNPGVKAVRDAGDTAIRHLQSGQVRNYESHFDDLAGDKHADCEGFAVWAGGLGGRGSVSGSSGFDFDTSGFTVGADRCFGATTIGFGLGYGQDRSTFADSAGNSKGSASTAATYGSLRMTPDWRINWMAGVGHVAFNYDRLIGEIDSHAHGQWSATQWLSSASTRFDRHFGDLRLAPYSRLDLATVQVDSYAETADTAYALRYQGQRVTTGAATVGLLAEYSHESEFGKLVPRVRIEYQHDFSHREQLSVGYAAMPAGTVYSLPADSLDRRLLMFALGSDFYLRNGLSFGVLYLHQQANDSRANTLQLRAVQKF